MISHEHSGTRVFILGAGFSKAAGMPDANELTDLVLNHDLVTNWDNLRHWISDLQKRLRHVVRMDSVDSPGLMNIERLFDHAAFDRELFLMRQHLCKVGRGDGETPYSKADDISHWLTCLERQLVEILITRQQAAQPDKISAFATSLCDGDRIITFNYDTLLESTLRQAGKTWSHGFDLEATRAITIYKLHGSLDWWMWPRASSFKKEKWTKLFQKEDANEKETGPDNIHASDEREFQLTLWRSADLDLAKLAYEREAAPIFNPPCVRGLAGLGSHKPLHKLVGSGEVWVKAFDALRMADEIYVVGWSASPFDTMARFHLASVFALRKKEVERVVVIDPVLDAQKLRNYQSIFGQVTPISKGAEHVDWAELFAMAKTELKKTYSARA